MSRCLYLYLLQSEVDDDAEKRTPLRPSPSPSLRVASLSPIWTGCSLSSAIARALEVPAFAACSCACLVLLCLAEVPLLAGSRTAAEQLAFLGLG